MCNSTMNAYCGSQFSRASANICNFCEKRNISKECFIQLVPIAGHFFCSYLCELVCCICMNVLCIVVRYTVLYNGIENIIQARLSAEWEQQHSLLSKVVAFRGDEHSRLTRIISLYSISYRKNIVICIRILIYVSGTPN